jgi:hypothetical protein
VDRNQGNQSGGQTGGQQGGQGQFPLSNPEYDLIAILHNKLQAIEAYQKYLRDAQGNQELSQLIQECLRTDQQLAQRLHQQLHRMHGQDAGTGGQQRAMGGQQGGGR